MRILHGKVMGGRRSSAFFVVLPCLWWIKDYHYLSSVGVYPWFWVHTTTMQDKWRL